MILQVAGSSGPRPATHLRGVLTQSQSPSQGPAPAVLPEREESGSGAACLVSDCALQVSTAQGEERGKAVCAEVCLWEGATDQSFWVSPHG